eukprot:GFUD01004393.1.p1 GENE.GFUD01004393.1~~GFUD01004393.1.p1  ORF type:complete len:267 (-),score=50.21 GFUD01004393.1:262-1032(-)
MTVRTILLSLLFNLIHSQIKFSPDCDVNISCGVELLVDSLCWDGSSPPAPPGECCPDPRLCPKQDCSLVKCGRDSTCPDGSTAPTPPGGCCPKKHFCLSSNLSCPNGCGLLSEGCWDGSTPPTPHGQCCPNFNLCPKDCRTVRCSQATCPDGSLAPVPEDGCCPDSNLCVPRCGAGCAPVTCWDGSTPQPLPGECCPTPNLCPPVLTCVEDCSCVECAFCGPRPEHCKDGSVAPAGEDCCACPDRKLCKESGWIWG